MDRLLDAKDAQDLQLDGCQVVEEIVQLDVLSRGLDALVDGDDQLIGLLDGELSLGVHDGLNPRLNEFLLEKVQVLKVVLLVDEIVLEGGNGPLHVEYSSLSADQSHRAHRHEVAHDSLGGDYAKLLIPFCLSLEHHRHHLLAPLNQLEVLLLGEFQTSDLVVEHADKSLHVDLSHVFDDTGLMTEGNAPEKLSDHHLVRAVGPGEDHVSRLIVVLGGELQLVWEVLQGVFLLEGIVHGVVVALLRKGVGGSLSLQFLPLLLVDLV